MTQMDTGEDIGAWETIRRGVGHSPELVEGIGKTLVLAVIASVGQIVVPIAVQQTIDRGLRGPDGPDATFTTWLALAAAVAIVLTSWASYAMTVRLFSTSERGLATLRVKAFRHVHDLPLLTQNTERRGALVSRVTSDVDQVSQFLVFGGLLFIVSIGQILVATVLMVVYSWQLALVVWICFAPLFLSLRYFQRKLSAAYATVRRQVGALLSAISEPVVGAAVVRSYAVEARTQERIDTAVAAHQAASTRAQGFTAFSFSLGGISAGLANAGVLIVGIWLGQGRLWAADISAGEVLAFAFIVTLFVGPVQFGTQVLTDAQNAIAGWRRVIGILDTPADLVDPGEAGQVLPAGALDVAFEGVGFAYPGGPPALSDIDLDIPAGRRMAFVGETGSGKSTLAKLLTRLMDPTEGRVLLDGVDVRDITETSLRSSVVLVPQEGFPLRRHARRECSLRQARRDRRPDRRRGRRAGPGRLARGPSRRAGYPGRPAWRVLVGGGAAAGRPAARPARRSRSAGPRRGHQRGRPRARDAHRPGTRPADVRPDLGHHRAPDVHGRGCGRGRRRRPRPDRAAWSPTETWSVRPVRSTQHCTRPGWRSRADQPARIMAG